MAVAIGSPEGGGRAPSPFGPIVEISSRRFALPLQCPCCGAAPDAELAIQRTRAKGREEAPDSARSLEFPYCRRCVTHVTAWQDAGVVSAGLTLAGIVLGAAIAITTSIVAGMLMLVAAIVIAYGLVNNRRAQAAAACGPACASADLAVAYFGWSGRSSSFAFRSPTYTARFAEDNLEKLVNVSADLRRLLDGLRVARLAVPTPAATMAVPPPRTTRAWIAKIDGAPSRLARRLDVRNALELTQDPGEKQELIRAAAKIELAPIRGRLERLGGGARERYLVEVIREVAADNLPAELQQAVLAELAELTRP